MQSLSYGAWIRHLAQNIRLLISSPRLFATWTLARLASFLWILVVALAAALPFALLVGYGGYAIVSSSDYQSLYTLVEANISDPESLYTNPAFESSIAAILAQWVAPLIYAFFGICGLVFVLPFVSTYGSFLMQAISYRIIREKEDFSVHHWKALVWGPVFWRAMSVTWHYLWRVGIPLFIVMILVAVLGFLTTVTGAVPTEGLLTIVILAFSLLVLAAVIWTVRTAYIYLFSGIYSLIEKHDHRAALMSSREMTHHRLWSLVALVASTTIFIYLMRELIGGGIARILPDWQAATEASLLVDASYSIVGLIQTIVLWLLFGNLRDFIVASLYDHLAHKHFFHI